MAKWLWAICLGAIVMVSGGVSMSENSGSPNAMSAAPARPGHFAELEELETARTVGTVEVYDLFLARHPDSRYAPQARREREALIAGKK